MSREQVKRKLDDTENFPGWERASDYLKRLIVENDLRIVGDIGGGAHPMLDADFVSRQKLAYTVFDIAQEELDKAPPQYDKVRMDISCGAADFEAKKVRRDFDLLFSHMFLEHIEKSEQAHRNFARMLKPGGLSVHFYPSPNNFPLTLNRMIPESLSTGIVRRLQNNRDIDGIQGKFKAFYKNCGAPSARLEAKFDSLGFDLVQHVGYVGHHYYKRIPPVAALEKQLRAMLLKMQVPMTTYNLLVLRKKVTAPNNSP
ncbi:MAG: class I SAM-dependent methyltransferase [Aestuariivirga sp.]